MLIPARSASSRSRTRSGAVSLISNREAARSLVREVNDIVFSLREACAGTFRMSLDETSVARSIVGDGLDDTGRSHVYGQPASCTALSTHSALHSQLIRETTFAQGHIPGSNRHNNYFFTHDYDPLLTCSNNCSSPNKQRGSDITLPPHLVLFCVYSSLQKL
jgi:hypothetical protein